MPPAIDTGHHQQATDRGLLCDKVGGVDPAAVPCHTDAEASANPTSGDASLASLRLQYAIAARIGPGNPGAFAAWPQPGCESRDATVGWELAGIAAGLAVLGVAAGLLGLTGL